MWCWVPALRLTAMWRAAGDVSAMAASTEKGETLMGLMVGLSVGLVVLAGGSSLLAQHLRGHRMAWQDSHLNHELRVAADWMGRELRKTQYSANAWATRSPTRCDDTFCDGFEDFSIEGNWIDFSHDRNHNGEQDNNECMGFRLSGTTLQAKRSCSASGDWQAITHHQTVHITDLAWQLQCDEHQGWLRRSVQMTLQARWPRDASRYITLSKTVHLRNNIPASQQALFCP
jgi:type II secretory pathway component PulJ